MADSVLELIAKNVLETVASLSMAGVKNADGSPCKLSVERARRLNSPSHLKGLIFQDPADDVDDGPIQTDEWVQAFSIVVFVIPTETEKTPVDVYNNAAAAALYLALMEDYTRGNLAINTRIRPTLFFPQEGGEYAGITFRFDVRYRNAIDDPYTPAVG